VTLRDVLRGIPVLAGGEPGTEEIAGIAYNSKSVRPGSLFAALRGAARNGLDFVAEAEANGAAAVLSSWPRPQASRAAWVQVADAREALALAAANFYGHPADGMKVVGVTGTKGKTTTTYLVEAVLLEAGASPGVIGTITYRRPGWSVPAPRTTPPSPTAPERRTSVRNWCAGPKRSRLASTVRIFWFEAGMKSWSAPRA